MLLAVSGNNLFAGTLYGGVFLSTNNGTNWTVVNNGLTSTKILALAVCDSNLFAGTDGGDGIYLSTNNGTSWTAVNNGISDANTFAVSGTNIFAGSDDGYVYLSSNNGTSWTAVQNNLPRYYIRGLAVSGTNLFVAMDGAGVYLSTNKGASWTWANDELTDYRVWPLAVNETYLFVGTIFSGVWKRSLSDFPTSVTNELNALPKDFTLSQNYPNPFNPSTTINYSLPKEGNVKLTVYNSIGCKVTTIVNDHKPAGNYSVQFNAANLASGIYMYRLESGNYSAAKKLIILK